MLFRLFLNFEIFLKTGKPHMLCVRFNQEPWALVRPAIVIRAAQLESVGGAYGGALLNVMSSFVFTSDHISGYASTQNIQVGIVGIKDQVKWVYTDVTKHVTFTDSTTASTTSINANPCRQEPALGSTTQEVIRNSKGQSYGTADFIFTTSTSLIETLTLCYKFATEPFSLYTNIELKVFIPNIETVSTPIVVKDVSKILIFSGTLSSTKDDLVKWVTPSTSMNTQNGENVCSGLNNAQGGQAPVTTFPFFEDFEKKTANVLFTQTVSSTASVTSLALCYKFGNGPYVYFDQHRLTVGHLTNVTALTSESQVVVTNTTLRYKAGK